MGFAAKFGYTKNAEDFESLLTFDSERITDILEEFVNYLESQGLVLEAIKPTLAAIELFFEMNRKLWHKKLVRRSIQKSDRIQGGKEPVTNEGVNKMMRVRDSGNNRALASFDQNEILSAAQGRTLQSATLRLYIEENGNNWGANGGTIDVHRLLTNWTEGNGFNDKPASITLSQFNALQTRGNGPGVTWKCATDTEINNQHTNCSPEWNGASFNLTPTATITIFKDNPPTGTVKTMGWIEFDVTSDLHAFINNSAQNYGWIVKKTNERNAGLVEFTSDEATTNKPELVIFFE